MPSIKIQFKNSRNLTLSARLEMPVDNRPEAYAIFAHVFTGSKNLSATRYISRALTLQRIAVLRFDFTGLGDSEGDFSNSNFSTNVDDILSADQFLKENYKAPAILVGHSLGGAAAIFASSQLESVKAVATVGAPSEPEHVTHLLECCIQEIEETGEGTISVGGRDFLIKKQFLEDLKSKDMYSVLRSLKKALLVLHSPQDTVVEIDNAAKIYKAAYHPKSFITLDNADHMLTNKDDAYYVGTVISSWVRRYIETPEQQDKLKTEKQVVARLGKSGYTTDIMAGRHGLVADESEEVGGNDFGPSPYELLNSALGACTAMTLQMYARRKKWDLREVKVHLAFSRSYKEDCQACSSEERMLHNFDICLELKGDLDETQKERLLEIAQKCPVHRTITGTTDMKTYILKS